MILHPGILALLLGGLICLALLGGGGLLGLQIARRWNPSGAEAAQLDLERRSWLVAVLVRWAIVFESLSLLLFVATAEDIHPLFVGAMCATGALNANPVGWHLTWIKLLLFFLGSLWLVIDHVDRRLPQASLTRLKFTVLLPLLPLFVADLVVMVLYFTGLQPEIITSCCGALFSAGGEGLASELSGLPVRPMIIAFYSTAAPVVLLLLVCLWLKGWVWRFFLFLSSLIFGAVALASVVSFVSVYFYQLPSHHCPFDMLQGHYHFVGYPLFVSLFGALLCGLVPQLLVMLKRWAVPANIVMELERRWLLAGLILLGCQLMLVSFPMMFGRLTLQAYL